MLNTKVNPSRRLSPQGLTIMRAGPSEQVLSNGYIFLISSVEEVLSLSWLGDSSLNDYPKY